MAKRRKNSADYAVFAIVILLIFCAVLSLLTEPFFKEGITNKESFAVSDGWYYADGTAVTEENRAAVEWENGTVSVFRSVTEEDLGKALYFRNHRQDVTVIADGKLLYDTYGRGGSHLRHCFNGHCMAVLPQSEQTYTVEVRFDATSDAPCTIPVIMMDRTGLIEMTVLEKSAPVLVRSVIFLTIALMSLGTYLFVRTNHGKAKAIFYGSCYIICQTLWALCDADITDIISISNEFTDVLGYFLIILRITLLIAFGKEFVEEKRQKPLSLCMWGLSAFQLIQAVLYLSGVYRLYDLHTAGMTVSAVALVVFSICMVRELTHKRSFLTGLLTLGVIINAILIILSQILYLSPMVAVAYQKIYRPFIAANDMIMVAVLISASILSGVATIKNRIESAAEMASRAKSRAEELQERVNKDSLTGLINHRAIMERLDEYANGIVPFAVGFIDLDDFRDINTKYGHLIGDKVIQFVAMQMQDTFDGHCGRHGGDEFVFIIDKREQLENLDNILTQYLKKLTNGFSSNKFEENIAVHSSIGVIIVDKLPQNYNTIVNRADDLMYRAKSMGKNRFIIENI